MEPQPQIKPVENPLFTQANMRKLQPVRLGNATLLLMLSVPFVAIDLPLGTGDALPDVVGLGMAALAVLTMSREPIGVAGERLFQWSGFLAVAAAVGAIVTWRLYGETNRMGTDALATFVTEAGIIAGTHFMVVAMKSMAHHLKLPITRATWATTGSLLAWTIELPFLVLASWSVYLWASHGQYLVTLDMPATWWTIVLLLAPVHMLVSLARTYSELQVVRTAPPVPKRDRY